MAGTGKKLFSSDLIKKAFLLSNVRRNHARETASHDDNAMAQCVFSKFL